MAYGCPTWTKFMSIPSRPVPENIEGRDGIGWDGIDMNFLYVGQPESSSSPLPSSSPRPMVFTNDVDHERVIWGHDGKAPH
jgi:hypothetical protein